MKKTDGKKAGKRRATTYCVSLPAEMLRRLDALAARKTSSRSRETRDALAAHLEREGAPA